MYVLLSWADQEFVFSFFLVGVLFSLYIVEDYFPVLKFEGCLIDF